jgi:hypothetical protein
MSNESSTSRLENDGGGTCTMDHPTNNNYFQLLDQEYTKLAQQHAEFDRLSHGRQPWTPETERAWLNLVNPLRDRMFEIATTLVNVPARSDRDLRTKAKVLHELASGETDDVVHQLATALCVDIMLLKPQ